MIKIMLIVTKIFLNLSLQIKSLSFKKVACGIPTSTWDAKAHDLCRCRVTASLRGAKLKGNGKSRHRTTNLTMKSHQNQKNF